MKYSAIKKKLINYLNSQKLTKYNEYKLLDDAFSDEDIISGIDILLSKKITMGEVTFRFEKEFSKYMNVNYALMTNSGSSANLLAAFALVNPKKKNF